MDDKNDIIRQAEALANTPTDIRHLAPHERVLYSAIGQIVASFLLVDSEVVSAIDRVRALIAYQLEEAKRKDGGGAT